VVGVLLCQELDEAKAKGGVDRRALFRDDDRADDRADLGEVGLELTRGNREGQVPYKDNGALLGTVKGRIRHGITAHLFLGFGFFFWIFFFFFRSIDRSIPSPPITGLDLLSGA
jgi:hypothetical protein